jgi:hypothetical protein
MLGVPGLGFGKKTGYPETISGFPQSNQMRGYHFKSRHIASSHAPSNSSFGISFPIMPHNLT